MPVPSQAAPAPGRVDVLGMHSGALGDVVLFAQLLAALRPAAGRVGLVAAESKARLLRALGAVDHSWSFESLPLHEAFTPGATAAEGALAGALPRCECLVSCFGSGDPRVEEYLTQACGASCSLFLPVRPEKADRRHLLDVWADAAGLAGVPAPFWPPPAAMVDEAHQALIGAGVDASAGFALLHAGAGSPEKQWPLAAFEALAERLTCRCVFVLGPAECERMGDEVERLCGRYGCLIEPSLTCLAGVAALGRVFVGCDSGPTHLAAAVGARTVALFGPSDPVHFAPRGRTVRVLHDEPLANLSVEAVAEAAAATIEKE